MFTKKLMRKPTKTLPFWQGVIFFCLISFTRVGFSSTSSDYLSFASGVYNLLQDKWRTAEFDLEYKFHIKSLKSPFEFLEFRPLVGILKTLKGTTYVYGGINFDLLFLEHIHFAPGFAAGYFSKGNGRDLGYPLEFRSGIELGWQFSDKSRLGVHFYHLSNASIGRRNPGEESLVLFYDLPIVRGFPFKGKF